MEFLHACGPRLKNPLSDTAYNFIRTLPFVVVLMSFKVQDSHLTMEGVLLAIVSGGIASGIGYTVWYMALRGLAAIQAAVVQLCVPVIAALGGILFSDEVLSWKLVLSSIVILTGILTVIVGKHFCDLRELRKTDKSK